jgi:hypothetical protein
MRELDAGLAVEHRTRQMLRRAVARRSVVQVPGLATRQGDEALEVSDVQAGVSHQQEEKPPHHAHRRKVAIRVEPHAGVQAGIDRHLDVGWKAERIPVGSSPRHRGDAHVAAPTAAVVDDDTRSELFA